MTALDWIVVLVWSGVTLGGFWKGAVRIVFGIGGLLIGLWLAVMLGAEVTAWWSQWIGVGWLAAFLGHGSVVLATVAVCVLAAWGVDRTVSALRLGWLNRLAGAAVAGVAAAIVIALTVAAAARVSPVCRELCQRSALVPRLVSAVAPAPPQAPAAAAVDPTPEEEGPSSGR